MTERIWLQDMVLTVSFLRKVLEGYYHQCSKLLINPQKMGGRKRGNEKMKGQHKEGRWGETIMQLTLSGSYMEPSPLGEVEQGEEFIDSNHLL